MFISFFFLFKIVIFFSLQQTRQLNLFIYFYILILIFFLVRADPDIRAEMILKIAVLAERFQTDLKWYIDTMLNIIVVSGTHVSEEIWHRVVQIITNHEDLQPYAARKVYSALQAAGTTAKESLVCLAAYVIGEFGDVLCDDEDGANTDTHSPMEMYDTLALHFNRCLPSTKSLLLSTYVKMAYIYDEVRPKIKEIYKTMSTDIDVEGQQRAVEYTKLSAMKTKRSDVVEVVLDSMPPFPERGNALEDLLKKKSEKSKDSNRKAKGSDSDSGSGSDDDDDDNGNEGDSSDGSDDEDGNSNNNNNNNDSDGSSSGSDQDEPNRPSSGSVDDLLGLGMGGNGMEDMLGGSTSSSGSAFVNDNKSSSAEGIPSNLIPKILECFRKGCTRGKQLLYMDGTMQVGIQQQYSGHQGKLMLFVTNKSNNQTITNLNVSIESTPFLKWNKNTSQNLINTNETTLNANGSTTKTMIQCMAMKPFKSPPKLYLSYTLSNGTSFKYDLRLPIVCTRFMSPANGMQSSKFMNLWSSIPDSKQSQSVCDAGCAISNCMQPIRALVKGGLRMSLVEGVTTNQYVVAGAGSYKTGAKDANGKQLMVGCLMKLECNPKNNKYRITVRAHHVDVASAVQTILMNQLAGVDFTPGGVNGSDPAYDGGATEM